MKTKNEYLNQLEMIGHYQNYPQMIPFVGENYDSQYHKKLLLVGESHFLPEYSNYHLDAEKWYNGNHTNLNTEEKKWIDTTGVAEGLHHSFFKVLNRAIQDSGISTTGENYLSEVSFYDYFQRPAVTGESIKKSMTDLDKEIALDTFKKVVSILKPDLIIFVSKLAVEVFENNKIDNKPVWEWTKSVGVEKYIYTNHPTSSWWNRATRSDYFKGLTSREFFNAFLEEYNFNLMQ
jgi:hypothetical protein